MSIIQTIKEDLANAFKNGNTLVQLIVINIAIFLLMIVLRLIIPNNTDPAAFNFHALLSWIALPLNALDFIYKPYTIISYQFIHVYPFHLLGNMVLLYFFGNILENYIGNKKTLSLYLFGGIMGAFVSMLICTFIPNADSSIPLVGASASVSAIAVAAAAMNPRHTIRMMFVGDVQIYILVLIFLVINIFSVSNYLNLSGSLSHIGGAIMGYIFIEQYKKGNDLSKWLNQFIDKLKQGFQKRKLKVSYINTSKNENAKDLKLKNEKIELILSKIKRSGYDSLSKEEKDYLFQYDKS